MSSDESVADVPGCSGGRRAGEKSEATPFATWLGSCAFRAPPWLAPSPKRCPKNLLLQNEITLRTGRSNGVALCVLPGQRSSLDVAGEDQDGRLVYDRGPPDAHVRRVVDVHLRPRHLVPRRHPAGRTTPPVKRAVTPSSCRRSVASGQAKWCESGVIAPLALRESSIFLALFGLPRQTLSRWTSRFKIPLPPYRFRAITRVTTGPSEPETALETLNVTGEVV
jgi:hypothetical protein